jgi:pyruvate-ferredoxin/flavodoxin oxidoreductase
MGSGGETAEETVNTWPSRAKKSVCSACACTAPSRWSISSKRCPTSVKSDGRARPHQRTRRGRRTALSGWIVVNALVESGPLNIKVIGGRYGLSSKEFTPAMVKASSMN